MTNYYTKKILALLLLALPFAARAQLETYSRYNGHGVVEPNINYFTSKKITNKIALTFFGLVEQEWSEALVGASYFPSTSFSIGGSIGIEHGTHSPRYSVSTWTGRGKTTLAALFELGSGKDNYLYKANLFHKCTPHFTFGATAWRLHGIGPNFRYTIPKLQTTIWGMPAYDFEADQSRLMIGISLDIAKLK
ncbi:hypothetical protein F0L74_15535 [Chitinophaga agrisoli]|uniref:Uncharacterized protein n=1 Tax=Chitinophaga agrisoli TaxID=2607653 RepID=A0A5B2VQM0_9BACT|nr:hypothetical protein [Chitinophaga agrisoli]KAA2241315.1 hypothetical protein F0L74_15535 [Chitinophaga agrisoli]